MNFDVLFGGIGRALSHPVYRNYWAAQGTNSLGRWMYRTAIGWLTWELTESHYWLGIVAFADSIPLVAFTLIAGAVTDQVGYFRIMRLVSITAAIFASALAALILGGWIDIWWVLILTLAIGSCEAITYPARVSAVNYLVPKADLAPAIALGSTTFNGARIIGPAIAGLMILAWGTGPVIAVAAASYLLFAVVLMIIPVREPQHQNTRIDVIADLIDGFSYVRKEKGIAFLLAMVGTLGLFVRPSIELLPGYAAEVFERGPDGLAILLSAIGVGAMIAGFWVAQRGRTQGLTNLVALATTGMGAMWIMTTFFQQIWVAAVFLAASGFCMLCANVCAQTLIQNSVDPRMRARVIGIFIVISWGFPALGAIALGWLATQIGIREAFVCASAVAVLLYLWSRREAPKVAPGLERV